MEVGRSAEEGHKELGMGTRGEQGQEMELCGGGQMGALLCFCTSVCLHLRLRRLLLLLCVNGWVVTGGLMNELALQLGGGKSLAKCSYPVSHFLRFLMILASLQVQDPSHLSRAVRHGCWSGQESDVPQQVLAIHPVPQ